MAKDLTSPARTNRGRFARKEPLPFTGDELRDACAMLEASKRLARALCDAYGRASSWERCSGEYREQHMNAAMKLVADGWRKVQP